MFSALNSAVSGGCLSGSMETRLMDILELYHNFLCSFRTSFKRAQWPFLLIPEVGNCTFCFCKGGLFSALICWFLASTSFTSLASLIFHRFMFLMSLYHHFVITSMHTFSLLKTRYLLLLKNWLTVLLMFKIW